MISLKDPELQEKIRDGKASIEEVSKYLINNFPIGDIVSTLADYLIYYASIKPIAITQQQLERHFKIIGVRPDGKQETRGRKSIIIE